MMVRTTVLVALVVVVIAAWLRLKSGEPVGPIERENVMMYVSKLRADHEAAIRYLLYGIQDTGGIHALLLCLDLYEGEPWFKNKLEVFRELLGTDVDEVREFTNMHHLEEWITEPHSGFQLVLLRERAVRHHLTVLETFLDDTYPHRVDRYLSDIVFVVLVEDGEELQSLSARWTARLKQRFTVISGYHQNATE